MIEIENVANESSSPTHLVKSILNFKQKIGLQFLDILCVSNRQKCRQLKNCPGQVSFFANPD